MLSNRCSMLAAAKEFLKVFSRSKHGAMAAWFALMLPLFLMGAALALDMSYLMMMKHKLQTAASASALAAAKKLPSKPNARQLAEEYIAHNMPGGQYGKVLAKSDIEFGNWDFETRTMLVNGEPINAISVTARLAEQNDNPLSLFFAPVAGLTSADLEASAIATFGGTEAWDVAVVQDVTGTFSQEIGFAREANLELLGCIAENFDKSQISYATFTDTAHDYPNPDGLSEEDREQRERDGPFQSIQGNGVVNNLSKAINNLVSCQQSLLPGLTEEEKALYQPPPCSGTHVAAGMAKANANFAHQNYIPASDTVNKAMIIIGDGLPNARSNERFQDYYKELDDGTCGSACDNDDLARMA
ncbi:MAG: TadG family pilus assembly protein, partial [Kiloniellales bacterium]|nr:TadG family pilus assembly protein [Kiloniellales bacterium]